MIPSITATDLHKLRQLISEAPGSYFMLKGPQNIVLRTANYKDNRDKFFTKVKDHLASDLAVEGSYQVCNGSSKTTTPIFLITKGSLAAIQPAVIIQDKQSSDINLVKENAELKAKLHYLELQMSQMQEDLSLSEKELEEAPDPAEKPSPWLQLAEQLAPAIGQVLGALAAKMLNPFISQTENGDERTGATKPPAMAVRYARPNAEFYNRPVPGQGFEGAGDLQGSNHSGSGFRDKHSETETEPG